MSLDATILKININNYSDQMYFWNFKLFPMIEEAASNYKLASSVGLHEKACWILCACKLKMNVPMLQKNFGWLSRQQDISVNSRVLEVAYNALTVYLGNIILL